MDFAKYTLRSFIDWNHFAVEDWNKIIGEISSWAISNPSINKFCPFEASNMRHLRLINSDVKLTNMSHLQVKVGSMGYDFYDGQFVSASACDATSEIALDTFEGFLGKRHGCIF